MKIKLVSQACLITKDEYGDRMLKSYKKHHGLDFSQKGEIEIEATLEELFNLARKMGSQLVIEDKGEKGIITILDDD